MRVIIVDGANVVGSRPDGWWRDRPGAARRLHVALRRWLDRGARAASDMVASDLVTSDVVASDATDPGNGVDADDVDVVVLVLEGRARAGVDAESTGPLRVVHAPGSGDDEIVEQVRHYRAAGDDVIVVTADRELRRRIAKADAAPPAHAPQSANNAQSAGRARGRQPAGTACVGPSWLLAHVDPAV